MSARNCGICGTYVGEDGSYCVNADHDKCWIYLCRRDSCCQTDFHECEDCWDENYDCKCKWECVCECHEKNYECNRCLEVNKLKKDLKRFKLLLLASLTKQGDLSFIQNLNKYL